MLRPLLSPLLFFLIAFAISLHQYVYWNAWFEWKDVHHELFIGMFAFAGIVLAAWRKRVI